MNGINVRKSPIFFSLMMTTGRGSSGEGRQRKILTPGLQGLYEAVLGVRVDLTSSFSISSTNTAGLRCPMGLEA